MEQFKNKKIAILGYGQEGQAVARYLVSNGFIPTIFEQADESSWSPVQSESLEGLGKIEVESGGDYLQTLNQYDVVVRSPGVAMNVFQPFLKKDALVTSQTKMFFELFTGTIVGITGTKGKGTTSALLYEMIKENTDAFLTGNIGKDQPLDLLPQTSAKSIVVYELSSFQLQDLEVSPHIGICLMVTEDHLDYHSSLSEYHAAKANLAKHQNSADFFVYNQDYLASTKIGQQSPGQQYTISIKDSVERGVQIDGEELRIKIPNSDELVLDISNRALIGVHNRENIAAAMLAALLLEQPTENIHRAIQDFKGLPFRLELSREVNGITYINDSVSTTPDTTIAAIRAFDKPVVAIVGGYDKGVDIAPFAKQLQNQSNLKSVVLIGDTGKKLKSILKEQYPNILIAGTYTNFEQAVKEASNLTVDGDIVLLSPGFASFDMFKNIYDRAEQFDSIVRTL